ncbi:MAG: peroxiredoxin [Cyanobacteria bacterium P01_A01_bin.114]
MALSVGTRAPDFTAKDDAGNGVSLSDYAGKTIILYFYPKDDTSGCTKEACSFRDAHSTYRGNDLVVLGVSMDTPASHGVFKQKFNLPFTLVADPEGIITSTYDVSGGGYSKRVTFIINTDGVIKKVYDNIQQKETHATEILADLGL